MGDLKPPLQERLGTKTKLAIGHRKQGQLAIDGPPLGVLYTALALQLQAYTPAGLAIVLALGLGGLFTALAALIGPKATNPEKLKPFECGSEPIGSPRGRYSVKFYQVAILFLVFDIEAAFMYPWAVLYTQLSRNAMGGVSVFGFVEMLAFVAILLVALAYVWRKKAIGWE